MVKWQKAYEDYLSVSDMNTEIQRLDKEIDDILRKHIPADLFEELYEKIARVEALHNEDGFKEGYMRKESIQLIEIVPNGLMNAHLMSH